jgi:hypothetical protein
MHRIVRVALAMMLVAAGAGAQSPGAIIVFGVVRNTQGVAIPGADVWIDGTDRRVVSNDSGEYRIDGVPSGNTKVMVRHIGFHPDSKRLTLAPGDTRQVRFALEGMLEELDAILVTAREGSNGRMQEFWARRMVGIGVFITRADIERLHPGQTVDLFRSVMGIRIISRGTEGTRLVSGRSGISGSLRGNSAASSACAMQYYVDGIFMTPGTFSVDEIAPAQLEAVEVFRGPSEVPARFRQRDTGCGLVVLWTREPPPIEKPEKDRS